MRTIIMGMDVFHTMCNFLVIIGKRFKDTGLRDKAVIAEGLIEAVLEGRQYNRTVRPQKINICRLSSTF